MPGRKALCRLRVRLTMTYAVRRHGELRALCPSAWSPTATTAQAYCAGVLRDVCCAPFHTKSTHAHTRLAPQGGTHAKRARTKTERGGPCKNSRVLLSGKNSTLSQQAIVRDRVALPF